MAKKEKKQRSSKPPAIDKLLKPSIGIALALLAYFFLQGLKSEIPRVDVTDELILREVFFGEGEGKNYAALCHPESSKLPISSVFQDAKSEAPTGLAEFILIDCDLVLPSGKSIAERFGLDLKKRPTIFVSGRVGAPKQVPLNHLKTGSMLTKLLRQMLEPHPAKITNTKTLKTKCLNKDYCAILLKGGTPPKDFKATMQNLIVTYPQIQFASMDATALLLSNLEEHLPLVQKGQFQFVMFKKVSGGLEIQNETEGKTSSDSRLITSTHVYTGNSYSYLSLSTFVSGALSKTTFQKIPSLPTVNTRTKKLEEAHEKKRQRILNQRQQQYEKQQQPPSGGAFDARTERRAERERRREEHRREHGYKERTPEEIAERERARRKRMDEEAERWNMKPEDAPEEGEPVGDYEFYFEDDEELEEGDYYVEGDEDEDEDVLDLD